MFTSILVEHPSLFDMCEQKGESQVTLTEVLRRIFSSTLALNDGVLTKSWLRLVQKLSETPHISRLEALLNEAGTSKDTSDLTARNTVRQMTREALPKSAAHEADARPSGKSAVPSETSDEGRIETLNANIEAASTDNTVERLQTLHRLVISATLPNRLGSLPLDRVPHLTGFLITRLQSTTDRQTFDYASAILCVLLTHHARLISQAGIEDIVSMLHATATAQPASDTKTGLALTGVADLSRHSFKVYTRLCHMTQLLLSLHRRKLAGRFDLLVPALQALLRCLFSAPPALGGAKPSFVAGQPAWLADRKGLKAKHAASYAKLLTTLFDPTPSSVAPPKSKSRNPASSAGMIDYTLAARRTAGQYAPYIVLSLCQLQLDGRFADDGMRDAIRPGISAALDAMELVDSGSGEQRRGASGRRKGLVDVVHQDAGGVWGVSAAQRTVLRTWWVEWERSRS